MCFMTRFIAKNPPRLTYNSHPANEGNLSLPANTKYTRSTILKSNTSIVFKHMVHFFPFLSPWLCLYTPTSNDSINL